jgi:MYXO-CTERM domain-containing protein
MKDVVGLRSVGVTVAMMLAGAGCTDEDVLATEVQALDDIDLDDFVLPRLPAGERAAIVRDYDWVDPTDLVPRGLLEDALLYYSVNAAHIPNAGHLLVVDLSLYSGLDRFWLVDLASGVVEPHKVAHGDGSDPDNDGYATTFGNVPESHKSSLGFALGGEIYDGGHPHSMLMYGLTPDGSPNGMANTNIRERDIVMHAAEYVDDDRETQQGRSNGCLALDPDINAGVVDRIAEGGLIYTAISSLDAPVGRAACGDLACDGDETVDTCAADCGDPFDATGRDDAGGGCSTGGSGGGAGLLFVGVALALTRRRRARGG